MKLHFFHGWIGVHRSYVVSKVPHALDDTHEAYGTTKRRWQKYNCAHYTFAPAPLRTLRTAPVAPPGSSASTPKHLALTMTTLPSTCLRTAIRLASVTDTVTKPTTTKNAVCLCFQSLFAVDFVNCFSPWTKESCAHVGQKLGTTWERAQGPVKAPNGTINYAPHTHIFHTSYIQKLS